MQEMKIGKLRCAVRYPKDFAEDKKCPVIIFLHGAGTRGENMETLYSNAFFSITAKYEEFPFVAVAPLCTKNTWFDLWEQLEDMVVRVANLPYVDNSRIYLVGNSMGGYGTWQLAMSMPKFFAAIVPICGGGMYWNAGRLINVPVWAFHGAKDTCVFPEESEKMVNAVNRCGGKAKLTIYPENTHDSWSDTYKNPEVFAWLLEHKNENIKEIIDQYKDSKIYG